ncbi:MAG: DUF423 domain-containing protein [Planctomycetota bacterium]
MQADSTTSSLRTTSGHARLPLATVCGALLAGLAVGLGAFGAHALKSHFDAPALATFETGVRYQMYHAFALILSGLLGALGHRTRTASWLFGTGILFFSGSLYGLALLEWRWLGPITPIGGTLFLSGWLALANAARKRR